MSHLKSLWLIKEDPHVFSKPPGPQGLERARLGLLCHRQPRHPPGIHLSLPITHLGWCHPTRNRNWWRGLLPEQQLVFPFRKLLARPCPGLDWITTAFKTSASSSDCSWSQSFICFGKVWLTFMWFPKKKIIHQNFLLCHQSPARPKGAVYCCLHSCKNVLGPSQPKVPAYS